MLKHKIENNVNFFHKVKAEKAEKYTPLDKSYESCLNLNGGSREEWTVFS